MIQGRFSATGGPLWPKHCDDLNTLKIYPYSKYKHDAKKNFLKFHEEGIMNIKIFLQKKNSKIILFNCE